jgi:hypothetical protein
MGDYYRSFEEEELGELGNFVRRQARRYRHQIAPEAPLIIDIDSTAHVQRGLKIEGVEYNFKKLWCLDSLSVWALSESRIWAFIYSGSKFLASTFFARES